MKLLTPVHWSWSALLLWLVLALPVSADVRLLVLGDSLSAGYGLDAGRAWVDQLTLSPQHDGDTVTVLNASISGETTAGGLSRLPTLLARHTPTHVLIALGANDGLRGLPLAAMQDNLRAMIALVREQGAQPLYAGIELPRNYGGPFIRAFRATQDQVAQDTEVPYLPFFLAPVALDTQLFQADGLHPTEAAQPLLAAYIGEWIQSVLDAK